MENFKPQIHEAQRTLSTIYTTSNTPNKTAYTWTHHIQTAKNQRERENLEGNQKKITYYTQKNKGNNYNIFVVRNYASLIE